MLYTLRLYHDPRDRSVSWPPNPANLPSESCVDELELERDGETTLADNDDKKVSQSSTNRSRYCDFFYPRILRENRAQETEAVLQPRAPTVVAEAHQFPSDSTSSTRSELHIGNVRTPSKYHSLRFGASQSPPPYRANSGYPIPEETKVRTSGVSPPPRRSSRARRPTSKLAPREETAKLATGDERGRRHRISPGELDVDSDARTSRSSKARDSSRSRAATRRKPVVERSPSRPKAPTNSKTKKKSPVLDDPRAVQVQEVLSGFLTDTKKDHVYIAKNALAAARQDIDSRTPYMGNGKGGVKGIIYDDVSPFKKMKPIQVDESQAPKGVHGIRLRVKHITKPNTAAVKEIFVPTVLAKVTPGILEPRKCRHFTTLRTNILGENEEEMRYLPYFGEGAEEDILEGLQLSELFVDKTKSSVEDGKTMERA
jgi:hypothetical protein